jgi:hypothetical protein
MPTKEADMNTTFRKGRSFTSLFRGISIQRRTAWALIIIGALIAFEIFNYSTTQFALLDVLGDLQFGGMRWATILAIAFCGIDFAGIARLFTPEQGRNEPTEVWYLFGAWLLAAAMNATLTWWGVAVAISNHSNLSSSVISSATLTKVVPVFVAIMVWLIRVLIIGTFSASGGRFLGIVTRQSEGGQARSGLQPAGSLSARTRTPVSTPFRPSPKTAQTMSTASQLEPTYHNLSTSARSARDSISSENRRYS